MSGSTQQTRRPLHVCHLAYSFYETDNRVMRYAKALVERGDRVDVISLRRNTQSRAGHEGGVRVTRLQRRVKTEGAPWTYLPKLLWFLLQSLVVLAVRQLRTRYDIVHVHNVPDFLVFAALVPKLRGAKVILDIHDILPELYGSKFGAAPGSLIFRALLLAERLSCRFADAVIVANGIWHQRLIERAVPERKCTTILNYPDLRMFTPRDPASARRNARFRILYPGSLSRHQGLDVAIKAFAAVRDHMTGAEFHIYGEGPARPELAQLIRRLSLDAHVRLFDPVPVDEVPRLMASADVGVEPKLARGFANEALSTKILEFMACGVPVIVSRTLVHAHYFDDSVVRFVEPGNVDDLAGALLAVYRAGADEAVIARALERAGQFGWHRRIGEYYGLVGRLCSPDSRLVQVGEPARR